MNIKFIKVCFVMVFPVFLFGCLGTGYKKTDTGLEYQIHQSNKNGQSAQVGDMLSVIMVYKTEKDSVLLDSRKNPGPFILPLFQSEYPGDIYEGLAMLKTGDSASFLISADSFYIKTVKIDVPQGIEPGSKLKFDLKLVSIQKKADYEKEQKERMEKQMKLMEEMKAKEQKDLQDYLSKSNIKTKPTESGLYFIEQKKGTGPVAAVGDRITVQYKGMLIDGTVFDNSEKHGQPFEFNLGKGEVIKGWDEAVARMRKGGKARLIVPSKLAYEFQGKGKILPFTTLIFDLEILKIDHLNLNSNSNPVLDAEKKPVVSSKKSD